MPQELRDQLEQARKASRRSLSQELIARAEASFDLDRDQSRDLALRAFCFLFSELLQPICINPLPDWRFDPWLFQAFKLAVAKLLDCFQPTGKANLPEFWRSVREAPDTDGLPSFEEWRERITESPEAMADYAVRKVLLDFNNPQGIGHLYRGSKGLAEKMTDPYRRRAADRLTQELDATYYGMIDAQRDLGTKTKSHGGKQ